MKIIASLITSEFEKLVQISIRRIMLITFSLYCILSSTRAGSRAAATYKMERFVIIVNGWKPLTIITKRSILDVAAALDPPLSTSEKSSDFWKQNLLPNNWQSL